MIFNKYLYQWCINHKREVQKMDENKPSFMYEVLNEHGWKTNALYNWDNRIVLFVPFQGLNIEQYLQSDYCLGIFMYGNYYELLPEHITSANIGNALVFADDYLSFTYLPDDYIPYHLF